MTTADAQHDRSGRITRGWRAFRRWRRTRPFWGGLFLALSGVEIFGTTQMSLAGLSFQMGPTGFLSWLIPTILVACGMLMWFTPQQRMFYAIVGSVTAVFSLIAVNLGGFFIGLLLGMVGGALGFAWTPTAPAQPDAPDDGPDSDGAPLVAGADGLSDGNQGWPVGDEPDRPVSAEASPGTPPSDMLHDTLPQPRNPLREPAPHNPAGYDDGWSGSSRYDDGQDDAGRYGGPSDPEHHSAHWPFGDRPADGDPAPAATEPSARRNPPVYGALLLALSLSVAGGLVVHNALPATRGRTLPHRGAADPGCAEGHAGHQSVRGASGHPRRDAVGRQHPHRHRGRDPGPLRRR